MLKVSQTRACETFPLIQRFGRLQGLVKPLLNIGSTKTAADQRWQHQSNCAATSQYVSTSSQQRNGYAILHLCQTATLLLVLRCCSSQLLLTLSRSLVRYACASARGLPRVPIFTVFVAVAAA